MDFVNNSYAHEFSQNVNTTILVTRKSGVLANADRKGWTNVQIGSKHWGAMLGSGSKFVVAAWVLSTVVSAESISFQSSPALVTNPHTMRATPAPETVSHAVTGDLGRGFSNAEQLLPFQTPNGGLYVEGVPRGSLVTSVNRRLNFGFYRSSSVSQRAIDAFTNLVLQTLMERKPKGARGRREQAEAKANSR